MEQDPEELRYTTALHEAGHAAMQWWRALPATALHLFEPGAGLCEGTGQAERAEDQLLVLMAGYVVEAGYGLAGTPIWESCRVNDYDEARAMLRAGGAPWLFIGADGRQLTEDEVLTRLWERACDEMLRLEDLVERLAEPLERDGYLSADRVAAICREFGEELGK